MSSLKILANKKKANLKRRIKLLENKINDLRWSITGDEWTTNLNFVWYEDLGLDTEELEGDICQPEFQTILQNLKDVTESISKYHYLDNGLIYVEEQTLILLKAIYEIRLKNV